MTLTEMVQAMEAVANVIKVFSGSAFGPEYIKSIKGPLSQAVLMPTGGVSLENVGEWIRNGNIAVGVGSELITGAKTGDFDQITRTAFQFIERIKTARK